jgi:lipoprotein-anchoring transpeptidase ErfK/SrfK
MTLLRSLARACPLTLVACVVLAALATPSYASRFGPPWQSRVVVDQTLLYTAADRGSSPVGPLVRGQIIVVTGESTASDGTAWTQTPDGFLVSSDVAEDLNPWVAEVTAPSVSVYARPNTKEPIRRTARKGDLLRVTGAAPGIEGDTATWWSTTEGYVSLHSLAESSSDWAVNWKMPTAADALNGWWGSPKSQANVRAGATTKAPVVGTLVPGDRVKVLAEVQGEAVSGNTVWYRIDGGRYAGAVVHSSLIARMAEPKPVIAPRPEDASPGLGTIAVSRSSASLTYSDESGAAKFTTYVSLGRAGVDTPVGEYSTMGKYRYDTMTSASVADADHAYYLPNVPFVEYYLDGGYAIHSTYWHDQFGLVESQGCINVTWADGAYLFGLSQPVVAVGDVARWATGDLKATPVLIVP